MLEGILLKKNQKITNTGKDVEKLELLHFAVRAVKWYGIYGKHTIVSQKIKHRGFWVN